MAFSAVLTQYLFTEEMNNTIKFTTREEQKGYFKINTLFKNPIAINFNLGDGLHTTIVVNKDKLTVDTMGCNYCIVRNDSEDATIKYYYYYITAVTYATAGQVALQLKLDILQTYYIDLTFTDCLITRAMLNRFITDTNGKIHFNYTKDSVLFEPESSTICPKRLVERKKVNLQLISGANEELYKFFFDNVQFWVYIYLSPNTYNFKQFDGSPQTVKIATVQHGGRTGTVDGSTGVLCYPVMKKENTSIRIGVKGSSSTPVTISSTGFNSFIENNEDATDKLYNQKISLMPPLFDGTVEYAITDGILTIYGLSTPAGVYAGNLYAYRTHATLTSGVISVATQYIRKDGDIQLVTGGVEFNDLNKTFTLEEIKQDSNSPRLNPKLQGIEFMSVAVGVGTGDSYEYDPQKLGLMPYTFSYAEPLTAEISKYYISYNPKEENEIYTKQTTTNYNGYIASNDISIPYNNSQYASFISANKNFWLQKGLDRAETIVGGVTGLLGSGIDIGALGTSIVSVGMDIMKTNLQVDNMRASKQEIKNAQGNAIFNLEIQDIAVTVELYKALDFELEKANDFNLLYGFVYNRIDNIKNHDSTRAVHNFIVANIEYIKANYPINATIVGEFKRIFSLGVRFWSNADTIGNIRASNYERSLENGI